jgi:uncharacterized protein YcaQ
VRVLTQRELNRALLARQLLLERRRLPVAAAVERVAGLQAQDARAPYLGLWTRLDGFDRDQLSRAIRRKRLVKGTLMRATLHLVSAADYERFYAALRPTLREYWRQWSRERKPVDGVDALTARATAFAAEPRSAAELREHLGGDDAWWRVRFHGPFLHAPTAGEWAFPRTPRYVAAGSWLTPTFGAGVEGTAHLARRYLGAFGPARMADLAAWSGLPVGSLRPAVELLQLRTFRDERGRELLDLPRAPLPDGATPAPARLLPPFDNLILSHADRTRVIADEHRRLVIRGGMVDPVFLVDGFVAGRWRLERGAVALAPFGRLPRAARRELAEEGERLEAFVAGRARA